MKKLILILLMIISLNSYSNNYYLNNNFKSVNMNLLPRSEFNNSNFHYGHCMMIGGTAMMIVGFTTPRTTIGYKGQIKQPFFKQYGRASAIISGMTILASGVVVTITF